MAGAGVINNLIIFCAVFFNAVVVLYSLVDLLSVKISECGYAAGFKLRGLSFSLGKGSVLLVTGKSSSGKTTLLRAITGTIELAGGFVNGRVLIEGRDISELKPGDIYRSVVYLPQEPWYAFVGHTVYVEICHSLSQMGVNCVEADFAPLGISRLVNRLTHTLSPGEMQRVLFLEATLREAKLVVLDSPFTYLDEEAKKTVKHFVKTLVDAEAGAIIADCDPLRWEFVEPFMVVLDGGGVRYVGKWSRQVAEELAPSRLGKRGEVVAKRPEKDVFARFKNVQYKYPRGEVAVKGFTDTFHRGVLTCICGPNGSGKTTLLKLGAGLLKPSAGSIERYGSAIYIPENTLSYLPVRTPCEGLLALAHNDENKVLEVFEVLRIKHVLDRPFVKLSPSERRKVAIATTYLLDLDGYFIDMPSDGLDDESANAVLHLLQVLLERGKAVIIATHDERAVNAADEIIKLP